MHRHFYGSTKTILCAVKGDTENKHIPKIRISTITFSYFSWRYRQKHLLFVRFAVIDKHLTVIEAVLAF